MTQSKTKTKPKTKPSKNKRKNRKKKWATKIKKIGALEQINFNAGGIDIGDREIYVAVPEDRCEESVRSFGTFTEDLHELVHWLKATNVDTVAMESTGVYWVPLYEVLEQMNIEVYLVDARKVKNVSGRKTDVQDCQWLQQLHTYGLLSKAFVPDEQIRRLRDLVRHRDMLIRYRSSHIQHMQKSLELMNIKLTNVITDITGVTGMKIIRAIVEGEQSPRELAKYRDFRCQKSEEEIAKSLNGYFKEEQLFVLNQALELYDYYTEKMKDLDKKVEDQYIKFAKKLDIKKKPLKKLLRSQESRDKNAPDYDLRSYLYKITGVDLTQVPGLNILNIQEIISEIGIDMSRWPSPKHFTSWLGLSPNNKITGGKKLSAYTKKTDNRANKAFRLAAVSAGKTNSAIGRFHRKMKLQIEGPKAVTATAHKLARIVYVMISKQVEYSEEILERHEKMNKERIVRNLKRKAANLGYNLVEKVA